ncbi:MAG TPA: helical backbone metal receptor [Chitinophagaceae bacterium]
MPLFYDQTGRSISLHSVPKSIVSLVPSQTELLSDLGLGNEVSGITKFCVHPREWFNNKLRVGGTKTVSIDIIRKLQPDLIIANKEENVKEQVQELALEFPVWVSDVNNLEDAYGMIGTIGEMVNRTRQADELITTILNEFAKLNEQVETGDRRLRAAYLIWKEPYMAAGGDTFINDMLMRCGFNNVFGSVNRYPTLNPEQLNDDHKCDLVILSSEPYPFRQKHVDELQQLMPDIKIMLADGEMFSWYGSRLRLAPAYFRKFRELTTIY